MIGQLVGNYRLVSQIGKGGMGMVYEAVHQQIGYRAAIKILTVPPGDDAPTAVARFFTEARAVNLIRHPGLAHAFEMGQLPSGQPYVIMEFLEGETLGQRLKRLQGRLGAEALRLVRQVAVAMAAVHGKGIVHRDLKPSNIMIIADPEAPGGERTKVLDFGIAKIVPESLGEDPGFHTQTGTLLGTPAYMSPEQCRGDAAATDRADVYSLGVILFQCIAGRPPFTGPQGEIIAQHLYGEPPPLHKLAPAAAPELCELVARMLGKDPAKRPGMSEVATTLEHIAAGTARPGDHPETRTLNRATGELDGARRRSRSVLLPAILFLLLIGIGGGGVLLRARHPDHGPVAQGTPTPASPPAGSPAPAPGPQQVSWRVTTVPAGALVVDEKAGTVLGRTPWEWRQAAGTGRLRVILRRPGYADRPIELLRSQDEDRTEPLRRLTRRSSENKDITNEDIQVVK